MTPLEDSIECLRVEMISEMQCELFEDYICICFHEKGESKKFEKTASLLMGSLPQKFGKTTPMIKVVTTSWAAT
ncbi:hypothetical protein PRIC1_002761 [Phytophthora ramorum]|uniref:uncharacterized protein n=1 Tax=Phytophthora ramorum TaxID=164328 RepID=UPI0030999B8F|nr:hypothetical protein KRP23_7407 [Phytophthora ramorum]